jgi:hypothetical protein
MSAQIRGRETRLTGCPYGRPPNASLCFTGSADERALGNPSIGITAPRGGSRSRRDRDPQRAQSGASAGCHEALASHFAARARDYTGRVANGAPGAIANRVGMSCRLGSRYANSCRSVEFLGVEPVPLDLPQGRCVLATTSGLFHVGGLPSKCYALLASWLDTSAPVGMFVNVICGIERRGVHSVAASPGFRGLLAEDQRTLPVVVGSWLFETGRLTTHSPDRTTAGDSWARSVGGMVPDRDQRGADEEAILSGVAGLAVLNGTTWPDEVMVALNE